MKYNKRLLIAAFVLLIVVTLVNLFYTVPLTISDSDPTTYVVVPMLMLPLLAAFTAKESIDPKVSGKDIAVGIVLFAVFLYLVFFLRAGLSYLYTSYRIDMLIFPIAMASIITLMYGASNLQKFKVLLVYAVLASPLLLSPLLGMNREFAAANTVLIYNLMRLVNPGIAYVAPITLSFSGHNIAIGGSCIGVGALIALVLFLIPIAYLYDGKLGNKAWWIISGFLLMLVLNVLRMLSISLAWFFYGPSNTILTIHSLIGVLLFYASLIAMILLAGRYGLSFPAPKRARAQRKISFSRTGVVVAAAFAVAYFMLTLNYAHAFYISPSLLNNTQSINLTKGSAYGFVNATSDIRNSTIITIVNASGRGGYATVGNGSMPSPIVILLAPRESSIRSRLGQNGTVLLGSYYFMDNGSDTQYVYYIYSGGTYLYVYHTTAPYQISDGLYYNIGVYAIAPASDITGNYSCGYNGVYTYAMNLETLNVFNTAAIDKIKNAYCYFRSTVSR